MMIVFLKSMLAPLRVFHQALVEDLEEELEDIGVGFLDLVEQHDAVRAPPHRLGEHATLAIADVSGGEPLSCKRYAPPETRSC